MIKLSIICLLFSVVFFIAARRLNKFTKYCISALIASIPILLLLFLMATGGDKAPRSTPVVYQGPNMVESYGEERQYNELLKRGMELESKGMFEAAIMEYNKALKVNRIALPSYYVLLDIANAQYLSKNKVECNKSLKEFIRLAEIEINSQAVKNPPFIILNNTSTRLAKLKSDVDKAENMLDICTR